MTACWNQHRALQRQRQRDHTPYDPDVAPWRRQLGLAVMKTECCRATVRRQGTSGASSACQSAPRFLNKWRTQPRPQTGRRPAWRSSRHRASMPCRSRHASKSDQRTVSLGLATTRRRVPPLALALAVRGPALPVLCCTRAWNRDNLVPSGQIDHFEGCKIASVEQWRKGGEGPACVPAKNVYQRFIFNLNKLVSVSRKGRFSTVSRGDVW